MKEIRSRWSDRIDGDDESSPVYLGLTDWLFAFSETIGAQTSYSSEAYDWLSEFFANSTSIRKIIGAPLKDEDAGPESDGNESVPGGADIGEFRTIDGSGNHPQDLGMAGDPFIRMAPSAYSDGFNSPAGADRPSARLISNEIFAQDKSMPSSIGASNYLWLWGQFVDHDIDLTREGDHSDSFNIEVPLGDPFFDPFFTGTQTIGLTRTAAAEGTGVSGVPREQVNDITAFLDASMVYGSDADREAFIRGEGGKLKMSEGDLLPFNTDGFQNAGGTSADLFLGGDVRANENVALTLMHTIFAREHNRLVDELEEKYPIFTDEELYQTAKAINAAQIQAITYNEFLPMVLGEDALSSYHGYDPTIDPQITNEFATVAFRLGHSMLSSVIPRMEENGEESAAGHLMLREAFFNTGPVTTEGSAEAVLRGLAGAYSQEVDTKVVDDVRNFLFGPPGSGGFDLVSLNIQRGRDQGMPDYNSMRTAFGLDPVSDFSEITSNVSLQQVLESVYGSVDNIDPWVGGLAEDPHGNGIVGELFYTVLVDQFTRIRDGDQFWYESQFSEDMIARIDSTNLSDIIGRNSDIDHLQENIFLTSTRIGGTDWRDTLIGGEERDLLIGFGGRDLLVGRAGDDDLFGDEGRDRLIGNRGDDNLDGGDGRDVLKGGYGDDVLVGGHGRHILFGGPGGDTFRYESSEEFGDKIRFFDPEEDNIDLDWVTDVTITNISTIDRYYGTAVVAALNDGSDLLIAKLMGVRELDAEDIDILY